MIVQLNTDNNILGTETFKKNLTEKINHELDHFTDNITRIEVHLSDQNADKSGPNDIQCKIESRIEGRQPVIVTSKSDSKEKAIDDAINKMKATLRTVFGKMKNN